MSSPFFSIIIPTYNRANTIKRCLDSVINQTYKNWEAIIVDNFSEDGTEEIVCSICDSRIHYYKNHNYGIIAVSRNFALDRAKGDWICFLDSDDSWDITKLENIIPYTISHDLIYHGYKTNSTGTYIIRKNKKLFYTVRKSTVSYVLQRSDPFSPTCTAVSARFLGATRFDESRKMFAIEDYDFFLQLMVNNPKIKHLKKYLAFYDVSTGVSHNQLKHLDRSRVIYAKYRKFLTNDEFRNVLRLYMLMRGILNVNIDPRKARKYFISSFKSSIYIVKFSSIRWFLMSFVLQAKLMLSANTDKK